LRYVTKPRGGDAGFRGFVSVQTTVELRRGCDAEFANVTKFIIGGGGSFQYKFHRSGFGANVPICHSN
jgi:hypothetical protein